MQEQKTQICETFFLFGFIIMQSRQVSLFIGYSKRKWNIYIYITEYQTQKIVCVSDFSHEQKNKNLKKGNNHSPFNWKKNRKFKKKKKGVIFHSKEAPEIQTRAGEYTKTKCCSIWWTANKHYTNWRTCAPIANYHYKYQSPQKRVS